MANVTPRQQYTQAQREEALRRLKTEDISVTDLAKDMGIKKFAIYDWRLKDPTFPRKLLKPRSRHAAASRQAAVALAGTKALTVRTPRALKAINGDESAAALSFVEGVNVGVALRDLQSEVGDLLDKELSREDVTLFATKLETVLQVLKSN